MNTFSLVIMSRMHFCGLPLQAEITSIYVSMIPLSDSVDFEVFIQIEAKLEKNIAAFFRLG